MPYGAPRDIRDRFTPAGFTATVDAGACIGCYKRLATACSQDALQVRASGGKVVVNQETCFGCGYCKQACPAGAIKVSQTMPLRESLHECFLKERGLDLVVDGSAAYSPGLCFFNASGRTCMLRRKFGIKCSVVLSDSTATRFAIQYFMAQYQLHSGAMLHSVTQFEAFCKKNSSFRRIRKRVQGIRL